MDTEKNNRVVRRQKRKLDVGNLKVKKVYVRKLTLGRVIESIESYQ